MNKQELIGKIKSAETLYLSPGPFIGKKLILDLVKQLDEPQKVQVPQVVADWYEEHKDDFEIALFRCIDHIPSVYDEGDLNEFEDWIIDGKTKPFQTLANMHQFGYTVEKEKRYLVRVIGMSKFYECLNFDTTENRWKFFDCDNTKTYRTHHTRKELEEAGFGWIFSCEGIEVEEVD